MQRQVFSTLYSRVAIGGLSLAFYAAAHAASGSLVVGSNTFYLETHNAGGNCTATVEQDGTVTVFCSSGSNSVRANSALGCLDSTGGASCAINTPNAGGSSSQVNCSNADYNLSSGKAGDNNCTVTAGVKKCQSTDGKSFAQADCQSGCGTSAGSGCCCKVGTNGCGTGTNCNGS